jgi:hypothetical protein
VAARARLNDHRLVGSGCGPGAYAIIDGKRWEPASPTASPPVCWDDGGVTSLFEEMRQAQAETPPPAEPTWVEGAIKQINVERKQGFCRAADGGARSNFHFALSAIEGEFSDEDLVPGRRCKFVTGPDVAPYEDRLRVARLILC